MVKLSVFLTRRPDLTRQQFAEHWRDVHAPLIQGLPESERYVRRYLQQLALEAPRDGLPVAPFDGVAEIWFDDLASMAAALSSEAYARVLGADEENFLDRSKTVVLLSAEATIIPLRLPSDEVPAQGDRETWSDR